MSMPKDTQNTIYYHLEQIQKLFINAKVTLYVRNPDLKDGDVLVSDDNYTVMQEKLDQFIKEKVK